MTVQADKAALRALMRRRRAGIPSQEREAAAEAVRDRALTLFADRAPGIVSGWLPIDDEFDPQPLMHALHGRGWRLCLPVVSGKRVPLVFRAWSPGEPLETRSWGIREPAAEAPVVEPDVLLVPLLAFDDGGRRLGYGGGYYDRTIAGLRLRKPVLAIGLAFDAQRVDHVPVLDYDRNLDHIVTPTITLTPPVPSSA